MSLVQRCLFNTQARHFARHAKGSFGREKTLSANASLPRHKDLFQEGYYNEEKSNAQEDQELKEEFFESPFSKQMRDENSRHDRDGVEYGENNRQQNLYVEGGVLKNYRKLRGQTMQDMLEGDYWRTKQNLVKETAGMFDTQNMDEKDFMRATKNFTMRMRLNRDIQMNKGFADKHIIKQEYGNYEKYEKNTIKIDTNEQDQYAQDKFHENYMRFIRKMPTQMQDQVQEDVRQDISDLITSQQFAHEEFPEKYMEYKDRLNDNAAEIEAIDQEQDFYDDPVNYERGYQGRLSPFAKEQLYRDYQKGMTIKDCSLKFGILQQRVKAIVFQKHLYWNEVYPRLGETHMRLAFEREALYAAEFPFIEYGQDLQVMAELEKGVLVNMLTRSEVDTNPQVKESKAVNQYIEKLHSRKADRIPLELYGSGPDAYLLQDWVIHRGKGAPRVSKNFMDMTRHYGRPSEYLIKKKFKERFDAGGIRFAQQGAKHSS